MIAADELKAKLLDQISITRENISNGAKEAYRAIHIPAVQKELLLRQKWIKANFPKYAKYFANGNDLNPSNIRPILVEVNDDKLSDLFRLGRLTWSLPFTKGYGRRLRFIILDATIEKVIGIVGLQSPPLDFPVRDKQFSYPLGRKVELVNQTMDIFTLGALPPYNKLLAGKLVALAAASNEVRESYFRKYRGRVTEISQQILPSGLVALTTTSAFGRSSLYNRLTFRDRKIAISIGYTNGYGSFHLLPVYDLVCEFLEQEGVSTRGGFGVGPRIVWQTYERAFKLLGLHGDLLKHGIKREAFIFPLISNLNEFMNGKAETPVYYQQSFSDLAAWWHQRWLIPRAQNVDGWHEWDKEQIKNMLILDNSITRNNHE